jgi:N-acetyl-1-D-myo-inositol-2-amino-2-deoxy-alpha-D-glucopyranoside deacetylase
VSAVSELRLMGVHAHADDETITMGGLYAVCADRGVTTCNICCTDGKLATIFDPDMPEETTRPRLAEIRESELRDACAILGVNEVHFLRYGDSGMAGEPSNDAPGAFWTASLDDATRRLVEHIRRFRPHVVVTYSGYGDYGHPDHIQAHRATLLAVEAAHTPVFKDAGPPWRVEKLYYTAFPVSWARKAMAMAKAAGVESPFGTEDPAEALSFTPDEWVTTTIDCRAGMNRKLRALRAHRSQIQPDWPWFQVPEEVMTEQFGDEFFQLAIARRPAILPETDVFAGLGEAEPSLVASSAASSG